MTLGIFLGIGESLSQMEKSGQTGRFINSYLRRYAKDFRKVYLFSYADESYKLPGNVILVANKYHMHRYLYAPLLPIVNLRQVLECNVIRGFGLTSAIPAFFIFKPFTFNWPYDYAQFLRIEKKYLLIPIFKILEILAFLKADKVFVATKIKLKKLHGQKYIFIPNGVDQSIFKEQGSRKKGLVFVGRFEKQKNLFFLIDAVSNLPAKFRSITFIGSGPQEEALTKYSLKKGVVLKIIAPVTHLKLPELLRRFSIFTFPSLAEGSPKVLLEAMALGLVPVVTNFSTAREIVASGKNGYVTTYNVDDYSQRLESLLSDDGLTKKISESAKLSIAKNFSLEHLLTDEIKALHEIVK